MTKVASPQGMPTVVVAGDLYVVVQVDMDVDMLQVSDNCFFYCVYDAIDVHGPHAAEQLMGTYEVEGTTDELTSCPLSGVLLVPIYDEPIRPYEFPPAPFNSIDVGPVRCITSSQLSTDLAAERSCLVTCDPRREAILKSNK